MTKKKTRVQKMDDDIRKAEAVYRKALVKLKKAETAKTDRHCTIVLTLPHHRLIRLEKILRCLKQDCLADAVKSQMEGQ